MGWKIICCQTRALMTVATTMGMK